MATHFSTLAWKIPWTEEPGRLQSIGSQRVGHNWATSLNLNLKVFHCGYVQLYPFIYWWTSRLLPSFQIRSVAQSCPTLCDPMNRSTPGLSVHQHLLEFTQTHIHQVSDAIQPSHPLLSPSPPAPNPPSIRVFSNESTLRMRWSKNWSFRSFSVSIIPSKENPGLISLSINYLSKTSVVILLILWPLF